MNVVAGTPQARQIVG